MNDERWLLPEGIDEVLPPDAWHLEGVRRRLLDVFRCWGYELVIPPFIEYLESLLTGTGRDLELQTFKLTDQVSGRMMGIRADITPQAARIDAHQLRRGEPTRLCYIGTVLHTRPDGFAGSRSPLQLGAELYGHSGVESDVEIISLMMQILGEAGVHDVHLDLGHVGIFRGLARAAGLSAGTETELFDALQRKAEPEIEALVRENARTPLVAPMLLALAELSGGAEVIDEGRRKLVRCACRRARRAGLCRGGRACRAPPVSGPAAARGSRRAARLPLSDRRGVRGLRCRARAARSLAGVATTTSAGSSGAPARRPASAPISRRCCASQGAAPTERASAGCIAPAVVDAGLDERDCRAAPDSGRVVVHELPGQQGDALAMGCSETFDTGGRRLGC